MSLRQIHVTVPRGQGAEVCQIMKDSEVANFTLMKAAPGDPTELVIATLPTGALTFLLKGVRPSHWYDRRKARQQIKGRLIIWAVLLVLIIAAMLLYGVLRLRA